MEKSLNQGSERIDRNNILLEILRKYSLNQDVNREIIEAFVDFYSRKRDNRPGDNKEVVLYEDLKEIMKSLIAGNWVYIQRIAHRKIYSFYMLISSDYDHLLSDNAINDPDWVKRIIYNMRASQNNCLSDQEEYQKLIILLEKINVFLEIIMNIDCKIAEIMIEKHEDGKIKEESKNIGNQITIEIENFEN